MIEIPEVASISSSTPAPISDKARIRSIDTLRGVALCGILLLNIIGFANSLGAYSSPVFDDATDGMNLFTFMTVDILFEGSMRAIFSMLFGAGFLIFMTKPDADPDMVKSLFRRRTALLVGFGLVNAYIFVWVGDILVAYGMTGFLLYYFRDFEAKKLAISSLAIFVLLILVHSGSHLSLASAHKAVLEIEALPVGTELTGEQEATLADWDTMLELQFMTTELVAEELEIKKSGYGENFVASAKMSIFLQTVGYLFSVLWDVLAMMLLGMAFLKWKILDTSRSIRFYVGMVVLGFGIGIPANYWETITFVNSGFAPEWIATARPTYDIGRLTLAIGYIGLVMLICKARILSWFRSAMSAVGRMALTNYLSQSIICNFIFMGFGFGLAGELERHQIYYVVFGVWAFQIITNLLWLERYRYGPAEWLWRSMTYKKKQPLAL